VASGGLGGGGSWGSFQQTLWTADETIHRSLEEDFHMNPKSMPRHDLHKKT